MSADQINSNEDSGDSTDDSEESVDQISTEEVTKRRFDPEALALEGPSRGDDDAIRQIAAGKAIDPWRWLTRLIRQSTY